jgi:hypothetical protein
LWDVLVASPGEIVNVANVSPVPSVWNITILEVFVWEWGGDEFGDFTVLLDLASLVVALWKEDVFLWFFNLWLWLGPGVLWNSPGTIGFDCHVVGAANHSEETLFTPVGTPGVSDNPELDTVFDTPTDDGDFVVDIHSTGGILEDTASVVVSELFGGSNTAGNWTTLVDFVHHVGFTTDLAVLVDSVGAVGLLSPAALAWSAVSADNISSAGSTVGVTTSHVVGAGFVGDIVVVNPLVSSDSITTIATEIGCLTRDQNLRSQVDIWPLSVSGNLDTIAEGGGGGEGPARTAVEWDVLVASEGQEVGGVDVGPGEVSW